MAKRVAKNGRTKTPAVTTEAGISAEQIDQVARWYIEGKRDYEVGRLIGDTWPGVSINEIKDAAARFFASTSPALGNPEAKEPADKRAIFIGWFIESCRHIYQVSLEAGDLPTALAAAAKLMTALKQ